MNFKMKMSRNIIFVLFSSCIASVAAQTCVTDGDCGTGTCNANAAFGRAAGWCSCPTGKFGRDCGFDWPDITSTPSNAVGGLPVSVKFELAEFSGFNENGDALSGYLTVKQTYTDQRTMADAGTYSGRTAEKLVQLGLLWVPEVEVAGWCTSVQSGGEDAAVKVLRT